MGGLKNQHLHGIKLAKEICDAKVEGLKLGSTKIRFVPGEIKGGKYVVDVKTAGSISLILQTVLPILLKSREIELEIKGGTDVSFAPPIDYYLHVLFPLLRMHSADIHGEVVERGYYPEGGGRVKIRASESSLTPIIIEHRGEEKEKIAFFNMRNLPEHIAKRLRVQLPDFEFMSDVRNSGISRGCSLLLISKFEKTIIASDSLCKRGVPIEKIAKKTMDELQFELQLGATVDRHMADHLPVFALEKDVKYKVSEITEHTKTNLWVLEQFGGKVEIKNNEIHAYM